MSAATTRVSGWSTKLARIFSMSAYVKLRGGL
jgi:hypothetical protein